MYSEIDDIRRRHSVYWDVHNNHGWIDMPDSGAGWNIFRGSIVGIAGAAVGQLCSFYFKQYHLIRGKYDPPESLAQLTSYIKTAHRMENAKYEFKYRFQNAVLSGLDWMFRLFVYKRMVAGIAQVYDGTNSEFWRRVVPVMFGSVLSSWAYVPVVAASQAFKADQTFPKELRIGYRSPFDALFKLSLRDPLKMFKNSMLWMFMSFVQTSFLMSIFETNMELGYCIYNPHVDGSRFAVKTWAASMSAFMVTCATYPLYVTVPNAVEVYPRQISQDMFKGSYRKALYWYWDNPLWSQAFIGLFKTGYFFKYFPMYFSIIWLADSFGYFKGPRPDFQVLPGTNSYGTYLL